VAVRTYVRHQVIVIVQWLAHTLSPIKDPMLCSGKAGLAIQIGTACALHASGCTFDAIVVCWVDGKACRAHIIALIIVYMVNVAGCRAIEY
jgi:hypothetical protein